MISLGTVDCKIWSKDKLLGYLYAQFIAQQPSVIDFLPEGSCASSLGLYDLLDDFCSATGYPKQQITIKTANMIEHHSEYNIVRDVSGWYEVTAIKHWLKGKDKIGRAHV